MIDLMLEPSLSQPQLPDEVKGKKFGIRALAYIFDFIIVFALNSLSGYTAGTVFAVILTFVLAFVGRDYYLQESESRLINIVIGVILNILYFSLFEWLYTGSLGKIILGMRVVNYEGGRCSLRQAVTRAGYRLFDGLVFGLPAYTKMKPPLYQRYGDEKAGTIVVSSKESLIKLAPAWWNFFIAAVIFTILSGIIQIVSILPYLRFF